MGTVPPANMNNNIWTGWKRKYRERLRVVVKSGSRGAEQIKWEEVLQDEAQKRGGTELGERRFA